MLITEPCLALSVEPQDTTIHRVVSPLSTCCHCEKEKQVQIARPSFESSRTSDLSSPGSPQSHASSSTLVVYNQPKPSRISVLRLLFVHVGAALTLFLATTDATIVSTILPTITSHFSASQAQYTWVSITYMLTQTAFQPLYGKVSDLIGRTTVLYSSMFIFALGSALCGAAQSIQWLILARALAGIGGGGIVSLVWTITSEIVDVPSQAKWSQALSVTWACSAIAGPILGGLFSDDAGVLSWRWAFYLNIPICAVAFVVLWLSLRHISLGSSSEVSWRRFGRTFDFFGFCIVIGFNLAADIGWSAPSTLNLIIIGLVVLVGGGLYEVRTKRDALFPPIMFKDLTIVIILIIVFLHNFAFNAGTFYLALFFQTVDGRSPLEAGVTLMPYSLGSALASMPCAWFIGYWQRRRSDTSGQKLMICAGLFVSTLGFGLMILLNENTTRALYSVYPLIAGLGIGMLFHAPYQVFTRALQRRDTASGTSAFFLVRFTGATVGLTIAGAIFESRLSKTLPPGVDSSTIVEYVSALQSPELKAEVVRALSLSIRSIWTVCCPCLGAAFMISIFTRNLSTEGSDTGDHEKSSEFVLTQPPAVVFTGEAGV
ncbi:amino acid permease ScVBA-like protein [Amylocystis lapponica]|nr:amino acid permease ScVBA-like protein [Amylocystis lapponica]